MSRIARAVAIGFPHHLVQRGNNKQPVFFDGDDRQKYLELLQKYSRLHQGHILAYCLMTNHVHLLTTPRAENSLAKMMQGVTLCYTQYINGKYRRTGRLWESRYHSCIVDNENYLWAVARYIEQNPVRAKMAGQPEDYLYSSAKAHLKGEANKVLNAELISDRERTDYCDFVQLSNEDEIRFIRQSTKTGRPLGVEKFIKKLEKKLGRKFLVPPVGRPRKKRR